MALESITKAVTRISVIEGLITEKLGTASSINYLEIGVGEGLTINDIMKKFDAAVYLGKAEDDERELEDDGKGDPIPSGDDPALLKRVSIVSVDPFKQADHVYGDYIMTTGQTVLPRWLTGILSFRETSAEFFSHAEELKKTYDIIFLDGSHRANDILSDLHDIAKQNLLNTNGHIIINGVYPPALEAQGDSRTGELWCGTAWKVLALLADIKGRYQNIDFYSTATDGGLLAIGKDINVFISDLKDHYGSVQNAIDTIDKEYLTGKYIEQFLTNVTKNSDKYGYRTDMDFVGALGIEKYFTEK